MTLRDRLRAPTFFECLHSVRQLSDDQIVSEFHELITMRRSAPVLRTMLVYYFFLGYRVALPHKLQRLAQRFDSASEFLLSFHLVLLLIVLPVILFGHVWWCIASST